MTKKRPFKKAIYVTRPILPSLMDVKRELDDVWNSGRLTNNGPKHLELENALKFKLKVPYLSLFNNGTIALIVACQSLRLSGEVITTPFTFPATPHVLAWNNIRPIFCDVDPITMNIDADKIESLITPQTTAIMPVHVYGTPCEVDKIQKISDAYGLKIIYDAAHAFGVELEQTGIGNFGDISMMSFHATKIFHTAEGGALLFKEKNLKDRVDLLKNFGIKNEEEVVMPGINGKLSEIHAIIGLGVLKHLDREIDARKKLITAYRQNLEHVDGITFLKTPLDVKSNYQYFVIRINSKLFGCSRDVVHQKFKEYNVITRKYFFPLCSDYPCYHHVPSATPSNLPVAHRVSDEVLCLPVYSELSFDDIEKICEILKSFRLQHCSRKEKRHYNFFRLQS